MKFGWIVYQGSDSVKTLECSGVRILKAADGWRIIYVRTDVPVSVMQQALRAGE